MDNIILGLLMLQSMTIYELNSAFKKGLNLIYSASYGNMQYAVKKLLENDMISFTERVDNGRNKKIYSINKKGISSFNNWMNEKVTSRNIETTMLSKIYFLGLIQDKSKRSQIIDHLKKGANAYLNQLTDIKTTNQNIDVPKGYIDIAKYQLSTIDYGICVCKVVVDYINQVENL